MAEADARGGLVDQVDGLVRQVAVGDVADRQVRGGLDRLVRDRDLVVLLVALADAHQDVDGLLERRLLDHDRLEAALEGGVALDVLAVLVERRRADALELAAGERRLEDVGGVDRALGCTGADERVELVDEEDRVVRVAELLDDLLEPLLELAAVLGAGDERADVEGQDALVEQRLGDIAGDDPVGQALRDRGLADAGLADQGRVVLGPSRQDLDDPLDLLFSADDGIQLSCAGGVREVDVETSLRVLVHDDRGSGLVLAEQQVLGEDILDHVLDHPTERTGAVGDVVAELDDVLLRRVGDLELHLLGAQLVADAGQHQVDDLGDLLDRQRAEDDGGVDPVEELRAEVLLQLGGDLLLHELVRALGAVGVGRAHRPEAQARVGLELLGAEVRGHDDDRVAEVDPAALGVRQVPSSRIWSRMLKTSGWAFSTSSSRTTQ